METDSASSLSLIDLLQNTLIFDSVLSHLSLSSIFRLTRTSHAYRELLLKTSDTFRYVDLSTCKGAYTPPISRIDSGGHSWRAERMDENLTEDEFYAGPLRGVLGQLNRMRVLQSIHTLVLDELASVTNDLLNEIVTGVQYSVRLLSIRRCPNVNQTKLQQMLCFICRPSRPEGTPRLQGLYVFSDPSLNRSQPRSAQLGNGVTDVEGAQLGSLPTEKGHSTMDSSEMWYSPSGLVLQQGHAQRTSWEETVQSCKGIICFDAVLCTHMHTDMAPVLHDASRDYLSANKPGIPPLATLALGPDGCSSCGRGPEGTPIWGQSDYHEFPLLWPPPSSGRAIDAVRPPNRSHDGRPQRLIVSCTWCVANRHCDSCHHWWCADCYDPKRSKKMRDLESLAAAGLDYLPARKEITEGGDNIKMKPAVTRECWECGRVCSRCAPLTARVCNHCKSTYCVQHNTGCDEKTVCCANCVRALDLERQYFFAQQSIPLSSTTTFYDSAAQPSSSSSSSTTSALPTSSSSSSSTSFASFSAYSSSDRHRRNYIKRKRLMMIDLL